MSNNSLRSLVTLILALLTAVPAWPQATPQAAASAKPTETTAATAETLPLISTPELFQVVNPDALKIGKLLDYEKRDIRITLRNISNQVLQIKGTRLTCDCLTFLEEVAPGALKPGEELGLALRIDGGQMKIKSFVRTVLLDLVDHDVVVVYLSGEVISMVTYAPTQVMNIGTFAGVNVPWERVFSLKTAFPPSQQVSLLPPPEDPFFSYELTSPEPQSYSLVVRPKLPLPKGKFHHIIRIPTEGLEHYGPVLLAIDGQVTGWFLKLDNPNLSFSTAGMNHEEVTKKEVRLVLRDVGSGAGGRRLSRLPQHSQSGEAGRDYVAKDEMSSDKLKELDMWTPLAETVQAQLPSGVTMTAAATPGAVVVTLSFPPQFFSRARRLIIPFYANGASCDSLVIQATP